MSHRLIGHTRAPIWENVPDAMLLAAPLDSLSVMARMVANTPDKYVRGTELEKYGGSNSELRHKWFPIKRYKKDNVPHCIRSANGSYVSIVGTRDQNEDTCVWLPEYGVAAIFDGWGGRGRSHQAARFLERMVRHDGMFAPSGDEKIQMGRLFRNMHKMFNQTADLTNAQDMAAKWGEEYVSPHFVEEVS